jgi:glycosyltransferase involved in cell wall biosynthesis
MTPATTRSNSMDILYHHRTQGTGAEGVHIAYVIQGLRQHGHVVRVLGPVGREPSQTAGSNPFAEKKGLLPRLLGTVSRHAPQWAFESLEMGYNLAALTKLGLQLRRRPNFIYERHAFFLGAGAVLARLTGTPYLVEVNEVAGHARVRGQFFVQPAKHIERFVFDSADAIIVVSDFLKENIVALGVPADKVFVVPNGVDEALFDPAVARQPARNKFGCDDDTVVVGFVGWFVPWHNLELLIDAFADVAQGRNAKLVLVGDGDLRAELQSQAARRGVGTQLVLPGAVRYEDIPAHVNAMDICVIPGSNSYRSPIKLFEYMAMEKAVVAPDFQPIRRIVDHDQDGLIFAPDDRGQLRRCLERLLDDAELRARLGANARRKILAQHLWRHNAEKVLQIHQRVAGRPSGAEPQSG